MQNIFRTPLSICLAMLLIIGTMVFTGCSTQKGEQNTASIPNQSANDQGSIKQSPDKYTWYVKNYVGSNLANVGYVSLGGDLRDYYGASNVKIVVISTDGSYVDISSKDALKEYVVTKQNIKPNTEVKLTFDVDEDGEEYDNLVKSSSVDSIVLLVKKVGSSDMPSFDIPLTEINACSGAEVRYVQDYVGRNLAAAGYISLGGELRDHYGEGNIKLTPIADDGSFVDTEDIEALKQYRVTSQSVEPNTEISFTFDPEYDSLVQSQSLQEIQLKVTKIG